MKRQPIPSGYRILVKLKKKDTEEALKIKARLTQMNNSSLYVSEKERKELETMVSRADGSSAEGYVISLGAEAYADKKNPWCKIGDLVQFKQYSGNAVNDVAENDIYHFINDVDVEGTFKNEELTDE